MYYFYNNRFHKYSIVLAPGEYYATGDDIIIQTVLGSCIAVCLYSDTHHCCGMNHFLLPEDKSSSRDPLLTESSRYGIFSMELLINNLIKYGVGRQTLKAKVFGGAKVLFSEGINQALGESNVNFIKAFLKTENIPVTSASMGGVLARKIMFFTRTNEILQERITKDESTATYINETNQYKYISDAPVEVDVTFFDK